MIVYSLFYILNVLSCSSIFCVGSHMSNAPQADGMSYHHAGGSLSPHISVRGAPSSLASSVKRGQKLLTIQTATSTDLEASPTDEQGLGGGASKNLLMPASPYSPAISVEGSTPPMAGLVGEAGEVKTTTLGGEDALANGVDDVAVVQAEPERLFGTSTEAADGSMPHHQSRSTAAAKSSAVPIPPPACGHSPSSPSSAFDHDLAAASCPVKNNAGQMAAARRGLLAANGGRYSVEEKTPAGCAGLTGHQHAAHNNCLSPRLQQPIDPRISGLVAREAEREARSMSPASTAFFDQPTGSKFGRGGGAIAGDHDTNAGGRCFVCEQMFRSLSSHSLNHQQ